MERTSGLATLYNGTVVNAFLYTRNATMKARDPPGSLPTERYISTIIVGFENIGGSKDYIKKL